MEYNRAFNTPIVIFTAFPGEMTSSMSGIGWVKVYSEHFGLPEGLTGLSVISNGDSYLCIASDNTKQYVSRYDKYSGTWVPTFTMSFSYSLLSFTQGRYMWYVNNSVYSSVDGSSLQYSGYLSGMKNNISCGANTGDSAVISAWYMNTPLYVGNLSSSTAWKLVGTYDEGVLCFEKMIAHGGGYVGIASDTISGSGLGGLMVGSGGSMSRTLQYPIGHESDYYKNFGELRSVNGQLFMTVSYKKTYGSSYSYELCLVDSGCTNYRVVRTGGVNDISYLNAMIYVDRLGMYFHFGSNNIRISPNGIDWSDAPQVNFSGYKYNAAYIKNKGFYVTPGGKYVYFGAFE